MKKLLEHLKWFVYMRIGVRSLDDTKKQEGLWLGRIISSLNSDCFSCDPRLPSSKCQAWTVS